MSRPGVLQEMARAATGRDVDITKSAQQRMAKATAWRPNLLYADPNLTDERWGFAMGRITRICEGMTAVPATNPGETNFEASVRTAASPRLAHAFFELYVYLLTKDRPWLSSKTDHNPFRRLPDNEALAMFRAKVEAICDKSTGQFGGWYTK